MFTNYIKNFGQDNFQHLYKALNSARAQNVPLWAGTIYIGAQPLYVECHIKWLADKIETYFVKTIPNTHVKGAKILYLLNDGVEKFTTPPSPCVTDCLWIGDDIYQKPDLIIHHNCIFMRYNDESFISVDEDDENNFYHLGDTHLLMRLFGYIFNDDTNVVLHGAVVANNDFGVLITGISGAGKSTLAAKCLTMGMKFVGDDRVALHLENGDIFADPIYTTVSLFKSMDNLKTNKILHIGNTTKNIFVLDKSQISNHIKIRAIIEPNRDTLLDEPVITKAPKAPILTRICSDYSWFSLLTRSTNPVIDYKKISFILSGVNAYSLQLSKSITDNAAAIFNLTNGDINV